MEQHVFDAYSQYYDLLYKDKNYSQETDYILDLIKEHTNDVSSILELGCGTAMHASLLASKGYKVTGIDLSETMLHLAEERKKQLDNEYANNLTLRKGDIRTFTSEHTFDSIISLFHVMSYMVTDQDLKQAFTTVKKHLKPDGIFVFDCWYGPGVLHDKPIKRSKIFENESIQIKREAIPVMHVEKNYVDVNFDIQITNKQSQTTQVLQEIHSMRYLFTEELKKLAGDCGLTIIHEEEWLTQKPLSEGSWNATFICKHT